MTAELRHRDRPRWSVIDTDAHVPSRPYAAGGVGGTGEVRVSIGDRPLFSWLHLSDLHFGHGPVSYRWNQKTVLNNLARDVELALERWPELPRIDAVFVTGDIAFSGAVVSTAEYEEAGEFIERVLATLKLPKSRAFMVPGNHDVQRDVARGLTDRSRADPAQLDVILDDSGERAELLSRFANYKAFADAMAVRDLSGWVEKLAVPGLESLTIVGLNSALLANDGADKGLLHLAEQQRALVPSAGGVCMVLTHHPLSEGWLRDESTLRALVQERTKAHLCGHVHDPAVDLLARAGGQAHVRLIAAAAHQDPKDAAKGKDSHGYNFASLVVDPQGALLVRSWPRRWFPTWQAFRVDHLGVPDRKVHDDKPLAERFSGSGLVADGTEKAGLLGAHWWGHPPVRWDELLQGKACVDVFGIALRDLFQQPNVEHIKAFVKRGGRVNVVLSDPRSKTAMARYDEDFDKPLGDRSQKVAAMVKAVAELQADLGGDASRIVVKLTRYSFKYSAYRLDGDILFVPYAMIPGKKTVDTPALLLSGSGSIAGRFLGPDLDALLAQGETLTPEAIASIIK